MGSKLLQLYRGVTGVFVRKCLYVPTEFGSHLGGLIVWVNCLGGG